MKKAIGWIVLIFTAIVFLILSDLNYPGNNDTLDQDRKALRQYFQNIQIKK